MKKVIKVVLLGTITFAIGFVTGFYAADMIPEFMDDPDFSDIKEQEAE